MLSSPPASYRPSRTATTGHALVAAPRVLPLPVELSQFHLAFAPGANFARLAFNALGRRIRVRRAASNCCFSEISPFHQRPEPRKIRFRTSCAHRSVLSICALSERQVRTSLGRKPPPPTSSSHQIRFRSTQFARPRSDVPLATSPVFGMSTPADCAFTSASQRQGCAFA